MNFFITTHPLTPALSRKGRGSYSIVSLPFTPAMKEMLKRAMKQVQGMVQHDK
jgi:hypothetical protein